MLHTIIWSLLYVFYNTFWKAAHHNASCRYMCPRLLDRTSIFVTRHRHVFHRCWEGGAKQGHAYSSSQGNRSKQCTVVCFGRLTCNQSCEASATPEPDGFVRELGKETPAKMPKAAFGKLSTSLTFGSGADQECHEHHTQS